jgi:signal transduction histidine kinase
VEGDSPAEIGSSLDEHRLRRLMTVGRTLVSQLDLESVLEELLEVARELTGARYAALGILDDQRAELERFLTLGVDEETREKIGDLPRGRGVLGLLIDEPSPIRMDDVGAHPRSYGFPPGHPPMQNFLGVPIVIRGEAYGNLYLTEKVGGPFDESDEEAAIVLGDYASIAIDNARLYSDVESRRRDLERAVARLEATTEVARAVGGETDLDRVMGTISKRARALVEARSLVILLEDRDELQIAANAGEFDRNVRGERLAIGWTTWGGVLRGLRPERVADVRSRLGISPGELGVRASAALLVPLNFRGTALGVIAAFDRLQSGPEFDEEDERLLVAFAASAATAVFTAKSVAEDQLRHSIAASEGERTRWARELHDDTLQALGAIRVMLASAVRSGELEALRNAGESGRDQLEEAITGLRGLISELRPAALDELGLRPAVEGLADYHRDRSGLEVNADLSLRFAQGEVDTRLAPELENTVYRVLQEALTNVAKHAGAERVDLQLIEDESSLEVVVRDDGLGFEVEGRHEGFGLLGMRERIELVGGEIDITSRPGAGTEVRARVPAVRAEGPGTARRPPAAAAGS